MPSSYPVPSCAVSVSAGMIVAVPLELLASPLKGGRDLGEADRSPPPRSLPLFSGDASSSSGTATIIPPGTGTAHDGTG